MRQNYGRPEIRQNRMVGGGVEAQSILRWSGERTRGSGKQNPSDHKIVRIRHDTRTAFACISTLSTIHYGRAGWNLALIQRKLSMPTLHCTSLNSDVIIYSHSVMRTWPSVSDECDEAGWNITKNNDGCANYSLGLCSSMAQVLGDSWKENPSWEWLCCLRSVAPYRNRFHHNRGEWLFKIRFRITRFHFWYACVWLGRLVCTGERDRARKGGDSLLFVSHFNSWLVERIHACRRPLTLRYFFLIFLLDFCDLKSVMIVDSSLKTLYMAQYGHQKWLYIEFTGETVEICQRYSQYL